MELRTNVAGLEMRTPIMNASGTLSFPSVLKKCAPCFGAVVTKSIGIEERDGYGTPGFAQLGHDRYVNAIGLSNPGYIEFRKELEKIYPIICDGYRVPLIVSIFGSTGKELVTIAEYLQTVCDAFELNYSCPHPAPNERVGIVVGSDPKLVHSYTKALRDAIEKPFIAKLTPNFPDDKLLEVAYAAVNGGANALSAINTVGPEDSSNEYGIPILRNRVGGISGRAIKKRGIEVVRTLRREFSDIDIIGMGGIKTVDDVIEYICAGANAVAVGTEVVKDRNTDELLRYMDDLNRKLGEMDV